MPTYAYKDPTVETPTESKTFRTALLAINSLNRFKLSSSLSCPHPHPNPHPYPYPHPQPHPHFHLISSSSSSSSREYRAAEGPRTNLVITIITSRLSRLSLKFSFSRNNDKRDNHIIFSRKTIIV